jgi:hypothetical protein
MRKSNRASWPVLGLVLVFSTTSVAYADLEACRDALDAYNSALPDVSTALRVYGNCVAESHGHDDCSSEFSSLQSAQDDFETAVSNYESECQ